MVFDFFLDSMKFRFFLNNGGIKCFIYFLGPKFDFKLESGVKIELNLIKKGQNVDFRGRNPRFQPSENLSIFFTMRAPVKKVSENRF